MFLILADSYGLNLVFPFLNFKDTWCNYKHFPYSRTVVGCKKKAWTDQTVNCKDDLYFKDCTNSVIILFSRTQEDQISCIHFLFEGGLLGNFQPYSVNKHQSHKLSSAKVEHIEFQPRFMQHQSATSGKSFTVDLRTPQLILQMQYGCLTCFWA